LSTTKNSMSVATLMGAIMALEPEISVILCADHGVGKSQIVRQWRRRLVARDAEKLGSFPLVDKRLAQLTEGDMIGLPSTDGAVTRFNPPAWFKLCCEQPCVLFLDELNRATPEVMQAAFQIVLDRELDGHRLHPLTRVVAAVNTGAAYTVNEMDPALADRFWRSDLEPTLDDWLTWAAETCDNDEKPQKVGRRNVEPLVTEFIRTESRFLDTPKSAGPGDCAPSRRSWERVSDALVAAGCCDPETGEHDQGHPLLYPLTMGFVGVDAAIAFQSFAKDFDNRVTGKDILEKGHTRAVKAKLKRLGVDGKLACIEKLVDHMADKEKLTERQGKNLKEFVGSLPPELVLTCWSKLTKEGITKMALAKDIHSATMEHVLKVFNVPPGKAGIGIMPNIPGVLQDNAEKNKD
jgi:hypothetical protein